MSVIAIVDDQDPKIAYAGTWQNALNVAGAFDSTLSFTTVPGSSFMFSFNGSQVAVVGSLVTTSLNSTTPVVSLYSVDQSSPSLFVSTNVTNETFGVTLFLSATLQDGPHQLFVNVTNVSGEFGYILDYIAYAPLSQQPSATYITSALTRPTSTVFITAAASGKSSVPVGAIVGGVIGGLALLLITAIAIWFFCLRGRRRGQAYFYKSGDAGELLEQEINPTAFQDTLPSAPLLPPTAPSTFSTSQYPTTLISSIPASEIGRGHSVLSSSTYTRSGPSTVLSVSNPSGAPGPSPNQYRSKAAEAGILSVPQPTTFHADSGVRFPSTSGPSGSGTSSGVRQEAGPLTDVPPMYTES